MAKETVLGRWPEALFHGRSRKGKNKDSNDFKKNTHLFGLTKLLWLSFLKNNISPTPTISAIVGSRSMWLVTFLMMTPVECGK